MLLYYITFDKKNQGVLLNFNKFFCYDKYNLFLHYIVNDLKAQMFKISLIIYFEQSVSDILGCLGNKACLFVRRFVL